MTGNPYVWAILSAFFFGQALALTPFGLRYRSVLDGAAISIPTSAVALALVSALVVEWSDWTIRAVAVFAAVGCLFPAAVTLFTFEANRRIGPNLTAALGNLAPIFAVVFAILILGEAPAPMQGAGLLVIVVGVTVLATGRGDGARGWVVWAMALPLAAALIRGLVQPAIKVGLASWDSPLAAASIGYVISALVVLIGARLGRRTSPGDGVGRSSPLAGDWRGIGWFAAVGLCNGLAVLTLYAALALGPVAIVAPLVACYPLVTLVLTGCLGNGVAISGRLAGGIIVTVAGVALLLAAK